MRVIDEYIDRIYPEQNFRDNQRIALISLYYNVKNPNDVYWRIKNGYSDKSVANAIRKYNRAGGVKLRGLVNRRGQEARLYES